MQDWLRKVCSASWTAGFNSSSTVWEDRISLALQNEDMSVTTTSDIPPWFILTELRAEPRNLKICANLQSPKVPRTAANIKMFDGVPSLSSSRTIRWILWRSTVEVRGRSLWTHLLVLNHRLYRCVAGTTMERQFLHLWLCTWGHGEEFKS